MESRQPQDAKTTVGKAPPSPPPSGSGPSLSAQANETPGSSTATPVRRYPKPPALLPRLVMLGLRPESWAEAARYPTHVTLIPLLLAIVLASLAVGVGVGVRQYDSFQRFAAAYDAHYPPLELTSDGTLKVQGPLTEPIHYTSEIGIQVLIDPTGKTDPQTIKTPFTVLVTDRAALMLNFVHDGEGARGALANMTNLLPPKGQTRIIKGADLAAFFAAHHATILAIPTILVLVTRSIAEALWATIMVFLVGPLIILAAAGPRLNPDGPDRRLILPRRAAYRIAAATLVPLVALDGVLLATNHPVASLLGINGANLFWFFSAGALAVWSGLMARRICGVKDPRRKAN